MRIRSVFDPEFAEYGKVLEGYDAAPFVETLEASTPLPEGVEYVPEDPALQDLPIAKEIGPSLYGGLAAQFGWCNGHNTKLNCLEYHRASEFNLGTEDFVLILAKEELIRDRSIDASACKAFRVPAGVLVEMYATSLHYAPCHTDPEKGVRVMVVRPKGTNVGTTATAGKVEEDALLWGANKWLLAHPESQEAADGAWVGITGENPDIAADI